jgi:hypothetical protein
MGQSSDGIAKWDENAPRDQGSRTDTAYGSVCARSAAEHALDAAHVAPRTAPNVNRDDLSSILRVNHPPDTDKKLRAFERRRLRASAPTVEPSSWYAVHSLSRHRKVWR